MAWAVPETWATWQELVTEARQGACWLGGVRLRPTPEPGEGWDEALAEGALLECLVVDPDTGEACVWAATRGALEASLATYRDQANRPEGRDATDADRILQLALFGEVRW